MVQNDFELELDNTAKIINQPARRHYGSSQPEIIIEPDDFAITVSPEEKNANAAGPQNYAQPLNYPLQRAGIPPVNGPQQGCIRQTGAAEQYFAPPQASAVPVYSPAGQNFADGSVSAPGEEDEETQTVTGEIKKTFVPTVIAIISIAVVLGISAVLLWVWPGWLNKSVKDDTKRFSSADEAADAIIKEWFINCNAEEACRCIPASFSENYHGKTKDETVKANQAKIDSVKKDITGTFGEGYKVEYKLSDSVAFTNDELNAVNKKLRDSGDGQTVAEACHLTYSININRKFYADFAVDAYRIDGYWYAEPKK